MQIDKKVRSQKRKMRVRKRVSGTVVRPRLSVKFSNRHIYAQCIDDDRGETLVFLSTLDCEIRQHGLAANTAGAGVFGKAFGEKAVALGVTQVVFDRNGRKYHGCIKVFADAAREAGLSF
jgi:large subunit ribosomal protein L18